MKFVKIYILLENATNKDDKLAEIINDDLKIFVKDCANCSDFGHILEAIHRFEIQKNNKKIYKRALQIMGFVYTRIMHFPTIDFCIPNIITTNLVDLDVWQTTLLVLIFSFVSFFFCIFSVDSLVCGKQKILVMEEVT